MKATEQWIACQQHILPDCDWQHITFTMPHHLWPFLNNNWPLLNRLFSCATRAMLRFARSRGIEIGLFVALHTYGRRLNQHPHIHLSVTRGGLCHSQVVWRPLFFKKKKVEQIWRSSVIRLLRRHYDRLDMAAAGYEHIRDFMEWSRFLEAQYQRSWNVHMAKKTKGAWRSTKYIGRYLKRPPLSASRLRHYSGGTVIHHYYNHRTRLHCHQELSQEEMIGRYISHIPARHFKMVRYYGFLSNRKRASLLTQVYAALEMQEREKPEKPGYASMMKRFTGVDPYECILCGSRLRFTGAEAGVTPSLLLAQREQRMSRKRWLYQQ